MTMSYYHRTSKAISNGENMHMKKLFALLAVIAVVGGFAFGFIASNADAADSVTLTYEGYDRGRARSSGFKVKDLTGPTITLEVPNEAFPVTVQLDPNRNVSGDIISLRVEGPDSPSPSTTTTTSPNFPAGYCAEDKALVIGHSNAREFSREMKSRYGWKAAARGGYDLTDWMDREITKTFRDGTTITGSAFDITTHQYPDVELVVTVISERTIGAESLQLFEDRLPEFVDEIRSHWPGADIVLRSRMTGEFSDPNGKGAEPETKAQNDLMQDYALTHSDVDFVDVWAGYTGYYTVEDFNSDGLHPNSTTGRQKVTDLFVEEAC